MRDLLDDLRFAVRMSGKHPGHTSAALLILALAIGGATAMFSIVHAVILRPLSYPDPDKLVMMWGTYAARGDMPARQRALSITTVTERWKQLSSSFEHMGWYRGWRFGLTDAGDPERLDAVLVSDDFLPCLGVAPALGRGFLPSEMRPGGDRVVLLGHDLWKRRFSGSRDILGKTLTLDRETYTVIGVMPEGTRLLAPYAFERVDLWAPISREFAPDRQWSVVSAIGRLKPGVPLAQAQAEMNAISKRLEPEGRRFRGAGVSLVPLSSEVASDVRQSLWIALGAVGCVLLIACANLAGFHWTRTSGRLRELGVRSALGAGRGRMFRLLLSESLMLSLAGGTLGIVASHWMTRAFVLLYPHAIDRIDTVGIDAPVLLFGVAVALFTGILVGVVPALRFSRVDVNQVIKAGSNAGGERRSLLPARRLLVGAEVGLALVLLIGTGLLLRSFVLLRAVDPGFRTEGLITLTVPLADAAYKTEAQQVGFAKALLDRVRTIPSVQSAAVSNSLPMAAMFAASSHIEIPGRTLTESERSLDHRAITSGYFRALGIPMVAGRDFSETELKRQDALILNQAAASHYWPHQNPIGQQILIEGKPHTIIGVAANVKNATLAQETRPEMYVPFAELPTTYIGLAVRTNGDTRPVIAAIREAVRGLDRNQTLDGVSTMEQILSKAVAQPRFQVALFSSFAGLALLLVIIGIYSVVARSVAQRTREIGIRMALGASHQSVLRLMLSEGAWMAGIGVVAGVGGAWAATRVLSTYLYAVPARDVVTFAAVSAILVAVCLAATYLPARRAARIDPMEALRQD